MPRVMLGVGAATAVCAFSKREECLLQGHRQGQWAPSTQGLLGADECTET